MTKKMLSFNNDPKLKEMLVAEIIKHRELDEIIQGSYERNGKFCAVGCSIESLNVKLGKSYKHSDHQVYETELGVPRMLARLEDGIFEDLTKEESKTFPERFISAIPVGANLDMVFPKFIVWLLGDAEHGIIKFTKSDSSRKAIQDVVDLYVRKIAGEIITNEMWKVVRASASYAADAAYAASASASTTAAAAAYAAYASAASASAASASYASYASAASASASAAAASSAASYASTTASAAASSSAAAYAASASASTSTAAASSYASTAAAAAYAAYAASASASASAASAAASSAADAAYVAAASADGGAYARQKARGIQADKLIELLKEAPIEK